MAYQYYRNNTMKGERQLLLLLIVAITIAVQQAFVDAQEKSCRVNARGEEVCFERDGSDSKLKEVKPEEDDEACTDKHAKCTSWADIG